MAAAVLGYAATRLGGGALRQTQEAAVSRVSSRLMPRFAHTEVQYPCTCCKFDKEADLKRIQKMKGELYEAAAEVRRMYGTDQDSECRMNNALLRELSASPMEWARKSQARHDVMKAVGFVTPANAGASLCLNALELAVRD